MLLSLESPLNGYQLMQGLEERSDGRWRPSPGSVYPALSQLEDEGLIRGVEAEGDGRAFELTDKGREQIAERGEQKAPWESQDENDDVIVGMWRAFAATARAAKQISADGNAEQIEEAVKILEDARRKLYRLLAGEE
jgi:DNA-binding PadR family transcriptional regulator